LDHTTRGDESEAIILYLGIKNERKKEGEEKEIVGFYGLNKE